MKIFVWTKLFISIESMKQKEEVKIDRNETPRLSCVEI